MSIIRVIADDHGREKRLKLPHEREPPYHLIRKRGVEGVAFLSGDGHLTELSEMDDRAGCPFHDVTSSGLNQAARLWRAQEVDRRRVATMDRGDNVGPVTIDDDRAAR